MENTTLKLIENRRSHRRYTAEQLTDSQLEALLTAAQQSPSANNLQPWHFTAVQDQAVLDHINREAHKGAQAQDSAQRSPRFSDPEFHVFYKAPTVIFITADQSKGGKALDCGIAVYGLALAAQSLGLGSVILGLPRLAFEGPARAELEQLLRFPPGHSFVIAIAIGHPDDTKAPPARGMDKTTLIR